MSTAAILDTTIAIRRRIEAAIGSAPFVGPPIRDLMENRTVSLFMFHVEPNRDLRNTVRTGPQPTPSPDPPLVPPPVAPPPPQPFATPTVDLTAIPLDLRYLVSVFRAAGAGVASDADELTRLGQIIGALNAAPMLSEAEVAGQSVRVTLEPASLDDMNRVWGIFPEESYQTSVIYLATPVWVATPPIRIGPPVLQREQRTGVSTEPPRQPVEAMS